MEKNLGFKVLLLVLILALVVPYFDFFKVEATISYPLPVSYIDENFPASYASYINQMKAAHPNWIFKAVHLNLDWNLALKHETYETNVGISLVEHSFGSEWKRDGKNYYQDGTYVTASIPGVAYVMDPRNFINDQGIFMFETLGYSATSQTVEAVQAVLSPTLMGSTRKSQYQYYGAWKDLGTTYAELIHKYAKEVGINPVHIASRIRQENGGNLATNKMIDGHDGRYNFYNIGAYDDDRGNAVYNGLNYAASQGWYNVPDALKGGMVYIFNKYIKYGQDTVYFERFDVNNPGQAQWLLGTGYMTNIFGCKTEAKIAYDAYRSYNMPDLPFEFHIPVYDNMPSSPCPMPTPDGVYFEADNTTVFLDDPSDSGVTDEFWIRSGPDTSSAIIEKIYETKDGQNNRTHFIRTGIGHNTLYDRIQFQDGRVGYILKKWVYEVSYTKVTDVTLNVTSTTLSEGDTLTLKATVLPDNADIKDVTWSSSNSDVATVDQNGNVKAVKEGVATIKVTTKDQNKSKICTVNVESTRVKSISLEQTEYRLIVGKTLVVYPVFEPLSAKNTEFTVTSSDTNVATVEDKIIRAVAEGTTTLTFKSQDGGFTATATLKVDPLSSENISMENLKVDNRIVTGVNLEANNVRDIKDDITTSYELEFVNISGEVLTDTDVVGTGTKILFKKNGAIEEEYTVLIYGDVDGSGVVNSRDLLVLKRYLLGKTTLNQIQVRAATIDKTAKAPQAGDLLKIKRFLLGKFTIEQ